MGLVVSKSLLNEVVGGCELKIISQLMTDLWISYGCLLLLLFSQKYHWYL